jgi:hypothetical protein
MRKYFIFGLLILLSLSLDASAENVVEVSKEFVVKNWWDRILLWLLKRIENENEKPLSICSLSLYPPFRDIYM